MCNLDMCPKFWVPSSEYVPTVYVHACVRDDVPAAAIHAHNYFYFINM